MQKSLVIFALCVISVASSLGTLNNKCVINNVEIEDTQCIYEKDCRKSNIVLSNVKMCEDNLVCCKFKKD
ncbi:hypothetical protein FQR65_LT10552 [Abscondita terminalis]|nr:hypothetical protein FQR65_LT10552 [Abscondita terminalis]